MSVNKKTIPYTNYYEILHIASISFDCSSHSQQKTVGYYKVTAHLVV